MDPTTPEYPTTEAGSGGVEPNLTTNNSPFVPVHLNISLTLPIDIPLVWSVIPCLILSTIIANTVVVLVLSQRRMRSPTNAVLLAMAVSDTLMILFPAPWLIYMFSFGNHAKPLSPLGLCYAYTTMSNILPALFHAVSIWLTLALAILRYICVRHALKARTWCTMRRVLKGIGLIVALAIFHQATRFFDYTFVTEWIEWEGDRHEVCVRHFATWVKSIQPNVYFNYYFWFRVIFVQLGPCAALILLNSLLFRAVRESQRKRVQLFEGSKDAETTECRRMREANKTTIMLFLVITISLFLEVPFAVIIVLNIASNTFVELPFMKSEVVGVFILFYNVFVVFSLPFNFAIYCGMSRQFRETFKGLFSRGAAINLIELDRAQKVN